MADTPVTVTFEGLMVFRRDRREDLFDVGLMPTKNMASVGLPGIPDHSSKITVTPNPTSGGPPSLVIDEAQIAGFLAMGNVWNLEVVEDSTGNIRRGIARQGTGPSNHDDPNPSQHDFGWLLDINALHPSASLVAGHLKPVIRMTNGVLTTIFKTDGIDFLTGLVARPTVEHFGFIGETAGLELSLRPGETLVLRVGSTPIFRIAHNPTIQFTVAIENVIPHHAHTSGVDHFQAYYALLFPSIPVLECRALRLTDPLERSPNPPPQVTINPFKCGGITMNDGDGPLG